MTCARVCLSPRFPVFFCFCLQNVKIINKEGIEEMSDEKRGIYIRSGIVVVTKGEWNGFSVAEILEEQQE